MIDAENQGDLRDELIAWYMKHPFPEYQPASELVQLPVNSTLCHVSVTTWMREAGVEDMGATERSDRCAGVAADTAKKTIELINAIVEGTYEPDYEKPVHDVVSDCMACHSSADTSGGYPVQGSEDCSTCHTDYTQDHP